MFVGSSWAFFHQTYLSFPILMLVPAALTFLQLSLSDVGSITLSIIAIFTRVLRNLFLMKSKERVFYSCSFSHKPPQIPKPAKQKKPLLFLTSPAQTWSLITCSLDSLFCIFSFFLIVLLWIPLFVPRSEVRLIFDKVCWGYEWALCCFLRPYQHKRNIVLPGDYSISLKRMRVGT